MNLVFENKDKQLNLHSLEDQKKLNGPRVCVSPFANRLFVTANEQNTIFQNPTPSLIKYNNNEFKVNRYSIEEIPENSKYIIPVGVHESPIFWAGYNEGGSSIFKLINPTYLKHLQEGRAYIMFDNTLEGYETPALYDFLYSEALKYNIPIKNIIYLSGNSLVEQRVEEWSKRSGKPTPTVIGYTHFEFDMYMNSQDFNKAGQFIPSFDDHWIYKSNNIQAIKAYNCLNRKPRNHRIALFDRLFHNGLLPNGLVSMNSWEKVTNEHSIKVDGYSPDLIDLEHSREYTPMRWDGTDNIDNASEKINRLNEKSMLNSFLTVVSEAQYDDSQGSTFLSEKTFKPIACSHPFIIYGGKYSLRELHKMGYVTFNNMIDESYDELDSKERLDAIIHIIQDFSSNPDKMQWLDWLKERVQYNKRVLEFNSLFNPPNGFHKLNKLCI